MAEGDEQPPESGAAQVATAGGQLLDKVIRGGTWGLGCLIVMVWLAGDYGFINSEAKKAAEGIAAHNVQTTAQQQALEKIVTILEEQRQIQARAGLLQCLKEAKSDTERAECVRKFPIK